MVKFIEVHDHRKEPMLIGLSHAVLIYPDDYGKAVVETDVEGNDPFELWESYEEVKRMIGSAQGGIPMERSEQY